MCMLVFSLFTTLFEERRNITKDNEMIGGGRTSTDHGAVVDVLRNDAPGLTGPADNNVLISAGTTTTALSCIAYGFKCHRL